MGMWDRRRPRYLFSGLMTCGVCGGGMIQVNSERIGCANARNKGMCDNKTTIKRSELETRVFDGLQHHLMDPELFEVFCKRYTERMNEMRAAQSASLIRDERRLAAIVRELDRLVDAIVGGVSAARVKDRMIELEAEQVTLQAKIKAAPEEPVRLHAGMATLYRNQVANLIPLLSDPAHRQRAAEIVRGLLERILLSPITDDNTGKVILDVHIQGHLAGILSLASESKRPPNMGDPDH